MNKHAWLLLVAAVAAAGCGSEVEDGTRSGGSGATSGSGGGGGAGSTSTPTSTSTSTSTPTTSSSPPQGTGGSGGGCEGYDITCQCDACKVDGGVCGERCNNPPSVTCSHPAPPAADEFHCAADLNCADSEACIRAAPFTDGCETQDCQAPPAACEGDALTCACIEAYLGGTNGRCSDEDGHVIIYASDNIPDPFWGEPTLACGDEVCTETERCQQCDSDDEEEDPTYTCWPAEAPDGEFVCGSRTCLAFDQFCLQEETGISSCDEDLCLNTDPECQAEDPCDCVLDACAGSDVELKSCEVGPDGELTVVCSPFV